MASILRHHRDLRAGHVFKRVAWELERTVISLLKETGLRCAGLQISLALVEVFPMRSMSRQEHKRKRKQARYWEATRDGETVVLAEHSTDGRVVGRPRRWGTETQGTH